MNLRRASGGSHGQDPLPVEVRDPPAAVAPARRLEEGPALEQLGDIAHITQFLALLPVRTERVGDLLDIGVSPGERATILVNAVERVTRIELA